MMTMKKIIKYLVAPLLLLALFACEDGDYLLPDSVKHIAFDGIGSKVNENTTDTLIIPVYLTTTDKSLSTMVSFDILSPISGLFAVEGEDFEILNKDVFELNGEDVFGNLEIVFINNDSIDGDKGFVLSLASSSAEGVYLGIGGVEFNAYEVKILDDEHPLAFLFGDYAVESHSDRIDESAYHDGLITAVEGSTTEIYFDGLWFGNAYNDIHATVNLDNDTIIIEAGQVLETHTSYGYIYMTYTYIDDAGDRHIDTNRDIVATLNSDSTITIHDYGFYVRSEAATGFFDWFDYSIWTKNE